MQTTGAARQPLAVLGISVVFFGTALPCFTVIQALGKPSRVTAMMLISGIIKLALNLLLIPFLGLTGAASAELVSCVYVCGAALHEVQKVSGCELRITETFVKPFYAGVMCAVTARLCCDLAAFAGTIISAGCGIAGGAMVYMLSVYLLCEDLRGTARGVLPLKKSVRGG